VFKINGVCIAAQPMNFNLEPIQGVVVSRIVEATKI